MTLRGWACNGLMSVMHATTTKPVALRPSFACFKQGNVSIFVEQLAIGLYGNRVEYTV